MNRFVLLMCVTLGCVRAMPPTVAGADDAQIDQYSSILEEYRTKTDLLCSDSCTARKKVCDIASSVCAMSAKVPERADFQQKCIIAREDCAKFSERCASCSS